MLSGSADGQVGFERGFNVITGVLSISGGVVLCKTGFGCIIGVPIITSGLNDLAKAHYGRRALGRLSEKYLGDFQIGKDIDFVLDMSGGTSSIIKAPLKLLTRQPELILDAMIDAGTGASNINSVVNYLEEIP